MTNVSMKRERARKVRKHRARAVAHEKRAATYPEGHPVRKVEILMAQLERKRAADPA